MGTHLSPWKGHNSPHFLAHVCCDQTAGWIRIPLSREIDLGPGDIVFDGDPAPPTERGTAVPPFFFSLCSGMVGTRMKIMFLFITWWSETSIVLLLNCPHIINFYGWQYLYTSNLTTRPEPSQLDPSFQFFCCMSSLISAYLHFPWADVPIDIRWIWTWEAMFLRNLSPGIAVRLN